jgi:DNA-directed RNA polymerase subunit RPC12/RpoP
MVKELKCQHCEKEWMYKGKGKYYATCPDCLYKVPIGGE